MHIIKLDATNSTNTFLKDLSNNKHLEDYTTVVTSNQIKGRGQRGTKWTTEAGKNLTFSVYKDVSFLETEYSFFISKVVAITIFEALVKFNIPNLSVKWPNDILSGKKKICGILIENIIRNNKLWASIIGIGLNTNQTNFRNLPNASSLNMISGEKIDNDTILDSILNKLELNFGILYDNQFSIIKNKYENLLFNMNKSSKFKNESGDYFMGVIKGVSGQGKLIVLNEDKTLKEYDLKEITMIY